MIHAFLKGIVLGIGLSFSIGPAFIALLQVGIQRGRKYGYAMATGILLSDCTLIAISLFGFTSLLDNPDYTNYIGIVGGIILILYGIYSFFNPPKNPYNNKKNNELTDMGIIDENAEYNNKESNEITDMDIIDENAEGEIVKKRLNFFQKNLGPDAKWYVYTIKGYFLNVFNPFLLFFWFAAVSTVSVTIGSDDIMPMIAFFTGTVLTTFCIDLIKSYLGQKIKDVISYKLILRISKIMSILLVGCGVYLILRLFINI